MEEARCWRWAIILELPLPAGASLPSRGQQQAPSGHLASAQYYPGCRWCCPDRDPQAVAPLYDDPWQFLPGAGLGGVPPAAPRCIPRPGFLTPCLFQILLKCHLQVPQPQLCPLRCRHLMLVRSAPPWSRRSETQVRGVAGLSAPPPPNSQDLECDSW